MPHLNYRPGQYVLGIICVLGLCGQTMAADTSSSLAEIKQLLLQQQETIERQQQQIEALQRAQQANQNNISKAGANQPNEEVVVVPRTVAERDAAHDQTEGREPSLEWEGYAVANYQRYSFYENIQDNSPEERARTDLERVVLELRYQFNDIFSFVTEIEFEHGGTGSAVEFEREETGEFESEIERGGDVEVEEAYLQAAFHPAFNLRIGEIVVPFGMINTHHKPGDYFTQERSLAETALFPSTWHATGISVLGALGRLSYQAQVITALDSSGFSGPGFVSGGTQGPLEFDNAGDLAFVLRSDYAFPFGATLGAAFYVGGSAGNRPRRNLASDALVTLYEAHLRFERGPWILRGQYTFGQVNNSDEVSRANQTFFNGSVLGISRTAVGHRAKSGFIEAGYDILPLFKLSSYGRFDVFGRYETYDTQSSTEGNIVKTQRYDRAARTFGVNYKPLPAIVFKAEYSYRTDEGSIGNDQDVYGLGIGVQF